MPQKPPLISVIVPCFNQGRHLAEALTSVAGQTHETWECLVIDDGSSDDSRMVACRFVQQDARFRYFHQAHRGQAAARNRGLSLARGNLIQFLDADDIILRDKFERQVAALGMRDVLQVIHCDYRHGRTERIMEPSGTTRVPPVFVDRKPIYDLALRWETELSIPIHCFLFDARIFRDRGIRFDESLPNHEDWECWMRVYALEPESLFVDRVLAIYRSGGLVTSDRRANYVGFLAARAKQARLWNHDAIMSSLLALMKKRIVHHYKERNWLIHVYSRTVPWPLQKAIDRFWAARRNPDARLLGAISRGGH